MRALPLSARFFFSTGARRALTSAAKQPPATTRAAPFRYRVAPLAMNRFMSIKPISPEEKQKVMDTWRIVEKDLNKHATTFYETMFEMAPAIRELFKNRNEYGFFPEDSERGLKRHSIDVMIMIGHAVTELHDLKTIEHELKDLGQRHAEYGVEPEHFDTMKKALFATLAKELGSLWTAEVEAAWDHSYAVCREMMEGPMMQEHDRLKNYKSADYNKPNHPH